MNEKKIWWTPKRVCAICTVNEVNYPHKICSTCTKEYSTAIEANEPWIVGALEISDEEHNQNRRDHARRSRGRLVPLSSLREI